LQNTVEGKNIQLGTTRGISLIFEDMLASQEKLYVAEDRVEIQVSLLFVCMKVKIIKI